jgi:Flp pilus assembly protein TadG
MPDRSRRGNNIIEFTILAPWYIFLFIGSFDMGIYTYALVSVQGAARTAALYCSTSSSTASDSTTACTYALGALRDLPNIGTGLSSCTASPLTVTASAVTGPDNANASKVTVTYVAPALAGIPGILPGQYTVTRTAEMRLRN